MHYPFVVRSCDEDGAIYEVRVLEDGSVEFEGFSPDRISKKLWEAGGPALAKAFPVQAVKGPFESILMEE